MRQSNIKILIITLIMSLISLPAIGIAGFSFPGIFHSPSGPTLFSLPIQSEGHKTNEDLSTVIAEKLVKQYMEDHSTGSYKIGEIEDRGTYYRTEISVTGNKEKTILVIDKQTEKVIVLK